MQQAQRVIKHAGFSGFAAAHPASRLVTADTDTARNPARFIPANVSNYAEKQKIV